jgi:hypothetical protein
VRVRIPKLTHVYTFIGDYNFLRQVTVCARNVTLFAIVTHRLLAIYFTVCTRSRVLVQKYLLGIKFTDSKARSRSLNLQ